MAAVSDHLRPTDADVPAGIYRVVGTGETDVTLLRVADADGRRVNTGEVLTVSDADLGGFESAENPDGNAPLGTHLRSALSSLYWSFRTFIEQLAANPLPTAVALGFLLAGRFGDSVVTLPDIVFDALVLLGVFGLVYVGSARL